jgi:hypothetical protein
MDIHKTDEIRNIITDYLKMKNIAQPKTTAERDAMTAVNGMIIYNTTTNAFNFYENGSWVTK